MRSCINILVISMLLISVEAVDATKNLRTIVQKKLKYLSDLPKSAKTRSIRAELAYLRKINLKEVDIKEVKVIDNKLLVLRNRIALYMRELKSIQNRNRQASSKRFFKSRVKTKELLKSQIKPSVHPKKSFACQLDNCTKPQPIIFCKYRRERD